MEGKDALEVRIDSDFCGGAASAASVRFVWTRSPRTPDEEEKVTSLSQGKTARYPSDALVRNILEKMSLFE